MASTPSVSTQALPWTCFAELAPRAAYSLLVPCCHDEGQHVINCAAIIIFQSGALAKIRKPHGSWDGKLILAEFRDLDDIAASHGLTPISSFGDNRPIPDGFDGDPNELDEILGPWDAWFPISEGLGCVEGLARILRADASLISASVDIIEELEGLASCLRNAGETASSFRLEVG